MTSYAGKAQSLFLCMIIHAVVHNQCLATITASSQLAAAHIRHSSNLMVHNVESPSSVTKITYPISGHGGI